MFVFDLYADGIGRGVGFVIESVGGLEGAVRFERKKGIVSVAGSTHQRVGQDCVGIRIGGVELAHGGTDWLVFGDGEGSSEVQVGRNGLGILDLRDLHGLEGAGVEPEVVQTTVEAGTDSWRGHGRETGTGCSGIVCVVVARSSFVVNDAYARRLDLQGKDFIGCSGGEVIGWDVVIQPGDRVISVVG